MKKIALIFSLFLLAGLSAFAQATDSTLMAQGKTPEERASHSAMRMQKKLGLTDEQTAKIQAINLEKIHKIDDLRTKYKDSKKGMGQELKAVAAEADSEYKSILSSDQYTKWLTIKEQKKEKMMQKRQQKKSRNR